MKNRISLAVVLLAAFVGGARGDVTLILPEGYTTQNDQIGFCNDAQCTSQGFFYDYKTDGNKRIVPLHGRKRLQIKLMEPDRVGYLIWESDVIDGQAYIITKENAKRNVTKAEVEAERAKFEAERAKIEAERKAIADASINREISRLETILNERLALLAGSMTSLQKERLTRFDLQKAQINEAMVKRQKQFPGSDFCQLEMEIASINRLIISLYGDSVLSNTYQKIEGLKQQLLRVQNRRR